MSGSITLTALADSVNNTQFLWDQEQAKADMYAKPTPLLDNLRAKSKKAKDGGELIIQPHEFFLHSPQATRITGAGYNLIDYSQLGTVGYPARFNWAHIVQPIGYSEHEKALNTGSAEIIDIIKQRTMNVKRHHDRMLQRAQLIQDTAEFTDILPLNGADYTDGAIENAAVGAQTNSYLNISKSTFSDRPGWQNQYATASASFSTYGVQKAQALCAASKRLGSAQNTLGSSNRVAYVSPSFYDNYNIELVGYRRFAKKSENDLSGEVEMFGDLEMVQIRDDMPTTGPWSFLLLDHAMVSYHVNGGRDAKQGAWFSMAPAQQMAMVSLIDTMVQTTMAYLGTSGILINADTY